MLDTGFSTIFLYLLINLVILGVSITFHEAAHAWTANRLGDPTAAHQGRISLNPLDHIDPLGTVVIPLMLLVATQGRGPVFGWAKPTPFNPWNLSNPKRDSALISIAGPIANVVVAIIFVILFNLTEITLFKNVAQLNIVLAIFNLIPIHPLDGFKVVGGLLPKSTYLQWMELERIGPIFLLFFIFFGGDILMRIISPILTLLGIPR